MPAYTPSETRKAHDAIGRYRSAVERACGFAQSLTAAAAEARDAAKVLSPYVTSPVPAIKWDGGPPTAEWLAGLDVLIAETKAGLAK